MTVKLDSRDTKQGQNPFEGEYEAWIQGCCTRTEPLWGRIWSLNTGLLSKDGTLLRENMKPEYRAAVQGQNPFEGEYETWIQGCCARTEPLWGRIWILNTELLYKDGTPLRENMKPKYGAAVQGRNSFQGEYETWIQGCCVRTEPLSGRIWSLVTGLLYKDVLTCEKEMQTAKWAAGKGLGTNLGPKGSSDVVEL
jgi:hypothetical protein